MTQLTSQGHAVDQIGGPVAAQDLVLLHAVPAGDGPAQAAAGRVRVVGAVQHRPAGPLQHRTGSPHGVQVDGAVQQIRGTAVGVPSVFKAGHVRTFLLCDVNGVLFYVGRNDSVRRLKWRNPSVESRNSENRREGQAPPLRDSGGNILWRRTGGRAGVPPYGAISVMRDMAAADFQNGFHITPPAGSPNPAPPPGSAAP